MRGSSRRSNTIRLQRNPPNKSLAGAFFTVWARFCLDSRLYFPTAPAPTCEPGQPSARCTIWQRLISNIIRGTPESKSTLWQNKCQRDESELPLWVHTNQLEVRADRERTTAKQISTDPVLIRVQDVCHRLSDD